MRLVDVLYTFPFLIFVILLMVFFANRDTALFGAYKAILGLVVEHPGDPRWFPVFQIVIVFAALGSISWLTMARIVRGQTLSLRKREFVEAAIAGGATGAQIIRRHIVPNVLGPVVVYVTLTIPVVILAESFLSFIGLGVQEPLTSLGSLIKNGAEEMETMPWALICPAAVMMITLLCFNFIGDGLRDAIDPKDR
jgi:oligopeptide transport system permease protein